MNRRELIDFSGVALAAAPVALAKPAQGHWKDRAETQERAKASAAVLQHKMDVQVLKIVRKG